MAIPTERVTPDPPTPFPTPIHYTPVSIPDDVQPIAGTYPITVEYMPYTVEEMNALCRPDRIIVPSAKYLRKVRLNALMRKKPKKKGKR
jgi:hypothetical protein